MKPITPTTSQQTLKFPDHFFETHLDMFESAKKYDDGEHFEFITKEKPGYMGQLNYVTVQVHRRNGKTHVTPSGFDTMDVMNEWEKRNQGTPALALTYHYKNVLF